MTLRITVEEYTSVGSNAVAIEDYGENFFSSTGAYAPLPVNTSNSYIYGGTITVNNCTLDHANKICNNNYSSDIFRINIVDYGSSFVTASNVVIPFNSKAYASRNKLIIIVNTISALGFINLATYATNSTITSMIYDTATNLNTNADSLLTNFSKIFAIVNTDGGQLTLHPDFSSKIKRKYSAGIDWGQAASNSIFYYETAETFTADKVLLTINASKIYKIMLIDPTPGCVEMDVPQASALLDKMIDRKIVNVVDMVSSVNLFASSIFSKNFSVLNTIQVNAPLTMTASQAYDLIKLIPNSSALIVDTYTNFTAKYNGDNSIKFRLSRNQSKIISVTLDCAVAQYQIIQNEFLNKLNINLVDTASNLQPLSATFSTNTKISTISVGSSTAPDSTIESNLSSMVSYASKISKIYPLSYNVRLSVSLASTLSEKFAERKVIVVDSLSSVNALPVNLNNIQSVVIQDNVTAATQYLQTPPSFVTNFVLVGSYADLLPFLQNTTKNNIKYIVEISGFTDAQVEAFLLLYTTKILAFYNSTTVWIASFQHEYITETIIGTRNIRIGTATYEVNLRESTYLFSNLSPSIIICIYSQHVTALTINNIQLLEKFTDNKVCIGSDNNKISGFDFLMTHIDLMVQHISKIVKIYASSAFKVNTFSKVSLLSSKSEESKIYVYYDSSISEIDAKTDFENNLDGYVSISAKIYRVFFYFNTKIAWRTIQQAQALLGKFDFGGYKSSFGTLLSNFPVLDIQNNLDFLFSNFSNIQRIYTDTVTLTPLQAKYSNLALFDKPVIVRGSGVDISIYLSSLTSLASYILKFDFTDTTPVVLTVSQTTALSSKFPESSTIPFPDNLKLIIVQDTKSQLNSKISEYNTNDKILSVTLIDSTANLTPTNSFAEFSKVNLRIVRDTIPNLIYPTNNLPTYQNDSNINKIIVADNMVRYSLVPDLSPYKNAYSKLSFTVGTSESSTTSVLNMDIPYLVSNASSIGKIYPSASINMTATNFFILSSKLPSKRATIGNLKTTDIDIAPNLTSLFNENSKISAIYASSASPLLITSLQASLYAPLVALSSMQIGTATVPDQYVQQYIPVIIANITYFAKIYPSGVVTITASQFTSTVASKFPDNTISIGSLSSPSSLVKDNLAAIVTDASKIINIYPTEVISLTIAQALVLASKFPDNMISIGSSGSSVNITDADLVFLAQNIRKFTNFYTQSFVTITETSHLAMAPKFFDNNMLTYGAINNLVSAVQEYKNSLVANASKFQSIYPTTVVSLTTAEADVLSLKMPPNKQQTIMTGNICFPRGTKVVTDQGILEIQDITKKNTFGGYVVQAVTETITTDENLVEFSANVFAPHVPLNTLRMSNDHAVLWQGKMKKAKDFVEGRKVPYYGVVLYNVLLEVHGLMNVEGMACETLHPLNPIAAAYTPRREVVLEKSILC